ncbi:MSMEG_6728 family protein [Pseudonocardia sp. H11422]|uniref:MSMEG_6728 family protein n=1 Tax=Pseudonocardia sp. H11422 TaxID=2835866 RepID=UPI001BDD0919|nr:MSMEG_6728 family protein [Pseudonocardia sp. H11422]
MQTFLPYPDFAASAASLDDSRLGKQRIEALQVVRALTRQTYGWKRHPAVRMWDGHTEAVASYGLAVCAEWSARGRPDTCAVSIAEDLAAAGLAPPRSQAELAAAGLLPDWLGDERVHRSHRAALLRKDPTHYGPLFPAEDPDLPYFWPV